MSDMPERIWVTSFRYSVKDNGESKMTGHWAEREEPSGMLEYIRVDLHEKRMEASTFFLQKRIKDWEAENERLRDPWVSVKDRLPDERGYYLCRIDTDSDPCLLWWSTSSPQGWFVIEDSYNSLDVLVTHWMTIPPAPAAHTPPNRTTEAK